ncbi:TPA: restriction endonuclease [Candidatus Woesearchaeota archaeon]|nr:restriction endonuclease [Candidatus Woesearchaeota archaeon]
MNLSIYDRRVFSLYESNSQRIRVLTENWFHHEMYCPVCSRDAIESFPNNTKVKDFYCGECKSEYQLKSQQKSFSGKVNDGAYKPMIESIDSGMRPHFLFLHYTVEYAVQDLLMVPNFFFTPSIIERRNPLSPTARKKGWVGCNILLREIPPEGKLWIVDNGSILKRENVASQWKKIAFMRDAFPSERGWIADTLRFVHKLGKKEFSLNEMYGFEQEFSLLHPDNKHIQAKIRQQLQIMRDKGLLRFLGNGRYALN